MATYEPERRPGRDARANGDRSPDRAVPQARRGRPALDRRPPAQSRRGDPGRRLHRTDDHGSCSTRPRSPSATGACATACCSSASDVGRHLGRSERMSGVGQAARHRAVRRRRTAAPVRRADRAGPRAVCSKVDTVELKVTIPVDDHRATIRGLPHRSGRGEPAPGVSSSTRRTLHLDNAGVVVRARRTQGDRGDTVIKLRPVEPDDLPAELRKLDIVQRGGRRPARAASSARRPSRARRRGSGPGRG